MIDAKCEQYIRENPWKARLTDIDFVSLVNFFKDFEITKRIHVLAVSE